MEAYRRSGVQKYVPTLALEQFHPLDSSRGSTHRRRFQAMSLTAVPLLDGLLGIGREIYQFLWGCVSNDLEGKLHRGD